MRTQLNKIAMAAGFGLAMAFTLSSCSSSDDGNTPGSGLQVQCPEGSTWNASAFACVSAPVAGIGCPDNTTLAVDDEGKAICVWQAVENSSSSVGGTTAESMWETFNDKQDGGTSTISMTENADGSITVSGIVASTTGSWGVGWGTYDNAKITALRAAAVKSISFKVTGDGQTYRLQLPTNDIDNYDYYVTTFETINNTEKTVKLCLADFKQAGWSGVKAGFSQNLISGIEFQASISEIEGDFGPVTISDLSFGTDACTSTDPPTPPVVGGNKWHSYTDEDDGGTSTITKTESADGSSVTVSGNMVDRNGGSWVGWGFNPPAAIKTATSISFKVTGDGKSYRIQFDASDIDGGASYYTVFATTNNAKNVTVCLSDFKQPSWTTAAQVKNLNQNNIQAINFQPDVNGLFGPTTISNVTFGTGACTSTENASTTPPVSEKQYCDYGPKWIRNTEGAEGGGCYEIRLPTEQASCEEGVAGGWAEIVSECPASSSAMATEYCTWEDGSCSALFPGKTCYSTKSATPCYQ